MERNGSIRIRFPVSWLRSTAPFLFYIHLHTQSNALPQYRIPIRILAQKENDPDIPFPMMRND